MKKTLKTQLVAALSMLLVAAVALTGATYAWFTSVTNATVGNIDLYVKASDALLLSPYLAPTLYDTTMWSAAVLQADIVGQQTASVFPAELRNTSSQFSQTSNKFYNDVRSASGALTGYTEAAGTEYSRFTLWVKSTNDGYVYINNDSIVKAITAVGSGTELLTEPGKYIANTVRVGFVPINYCATSKSGAKSVGEDWAHAILWQPNSETHLPATTYGGTSPAGFQEAMSVIDDTAVSDVAAQHSYNFVAGKTTSGTILPADAYTSAINEIALMNLSKDTMQQFAVYIWVEGTDLDTENAVAKNAFSTFLKFGQNKNCTIGAYSFS